MVVVPGAWQRWLTPLRSGVRTPTYSFAAHLLLLAPTPRLTGQVGGDQGPRWR